MQMVSILAREWLEAKTLHDLIYTIIRPSALYGIRCISEGKSKIH